MRSAGLRPASLTHQRRLSTVIGATCLAFLVNGCSASLARPVGLISVRNDFAQSVKVEVDSPNAFPWSIFGPQRMVSWVPPWHSGWCEAATIGLSAQGSADTLPQTTVVVSVQSVHGSTTLSGSLAAVQGGGLSLTIDRTGMVLISRGRPSPSSPSCEEYPLRAHP